MKKIKVLFVCMGNICRSPTAEGIFTQLVQESGLSDRIEIDSAGTHSYHIGKTPDKRAQAAALQRGFDLSQLRGRQACTEDFVQFDYILAMDRDNVSNLKLIVWLSFHCFWNLQNRQRRVMCLIPITVRGRALSTFWIWCSRPRWVCWLIFVSSIGCSSFVLFYQPQL